MWFSFQGSQESSHRLGVAHDTFARQPCRPQATKITSRPAVDWSRVTLTSMTRSDGGAPRRWPVAVLAFRTAEVRRRLEVGEVEGRVLLTRETTKKPAQFVFTTGMSSG